MRKPISTRMAPGVWLAGDAISNDPLEAARDLSSLEVTAPTAAEEF